MSTVYPEWQIESWRLDEAINDLYLEIALLFTLDVKLLCLLQILAKYYHDENLRRHFDKFKNQKRPMSEL